LIQTKQTKPVKTCSAGGEKQRLLAKQLKIAAQKQAAPKSEEAPEEAITTNIRNGLVPANGQTIDQLFNKPKRKKNQNHPKSRVPRCC
jgi:hypothetical protein